MTLFLVLIFSVFLSLWLGILEISFVDIIQIVFNNFNFISIDSTNNRLQQSSIILNEIRIPRILGAIVVGGSLALSGLIFQGVFTNPLVSP